MEFNKVMHGATEVVKVMMGTQLVYEKESAPPVSEIVDAGLVVYYDFKDKTNSSPDRAVATDLSGNNNHSNLLNFNWSASSGYTAAGLQFDGVDDMIKGTGHTGLPTGNDSFSIECVSMIPTGYDPAAYMTLVAIGLGPMFTPTNGYACIELDNNSDAIYYARYVGDATYVYGDVAFPTGVRTHLALTYDGTTNAIRWYIDGADFGGRVLSGPLTSQMNPPLYIGYDEHDYSEPRLHTFQAVRIYNRPLNGEEVLQNYQYDNARWS